MNDEAKSSNNADLGFTLQKIIVDKYQLTINEECKRNFDSAYNSDYYDNVSNLIARIFDTLNSYPKICTCFTKDSDENTKQFPHNFVLDNGKTISFSTCKSSYSKAKVCPQIIGQGGLNTFNEYFSEYISEKVVNKVQIKEIIYNNIHSMLPMFLEHYFISDLTVIVFNKDSKLCFEIFEKNRVIDIKYDRDLFSFTRNLDTWNESTTLKYKGISIAEIQIHKNRTFKFRLYIKSLSNFINDVVYNNETLGISAEVAVCSLFNIEIPFEYKNRYSTNLQNDLMPIITKAFKHLPKVVSTTGTNSGERGGTSKSSFDFTLEGNKTLSLKTNKGNKVCPPEVGQPGAKTAYLYFGHLTESNCISDDIFKKIALSRIYDMMTIYTNHLLDSDFLLWIYKKKNEYDYLILNSDFAKDFTWKKELFTFTKNSLEEWNESNTVKYNGITIGEFQIHKKRSCYKFRFNMKNFIEIIKNNQ